MKTSCKELKRMARETLAGQYRTPMGAFLLAGLITFAIELPFSMLLQNEYASAFQKVIYYMVEFLISLLNAVLLAGVAGIHLDMAKKRQTRATYVIRPLKNRPDRYLIAAFFMMIFTLLSVIPAGCGIAYAMIESTAQAIFIAICLGGISAVLVTYVELKLSVVYYIMLEDESILPWEAMKQSAALMNGNMWRLFYMQLSFLGYYLLGLLSFGIGLLWVLPYQTQTLTRFYLDLRENVSEDTFQYNENM